MDRSNKFLRTDNIINFDSGTFEDFICESSSKGNQRKLTDGVNFLKEDFLGLESISEVFTCILLKNIRNLNYIEYKLCTVDGMPGFCYSKDFLDSSFTLLPVGRVLNCNRVFDKTFKDITPVERFNLVINLLKKLTELDLTEHIGKLIFLDSLTLNEDRHLFNIAVLSDGEAYYECPVFDNGGAFLSDLKAYPLDVPLTINLGKVKAKPFSVSFNKQVQIVKGTGVKLLEIDYNNLVKEVEKFISDHPSNFVERASKILFIRLKEMEGLSWKRL